MKYDYKAQEEKLKKEIEKLNKNAIDKWEIEKITKKYGMTTALLFRTATKPVAAAPNGIICNEYYINKQITVYNDLTVEIENC